MRDGDYATTAMPPLHPPSTSSASASVRVPTIVPLLTQPPPTSSRGGHVPSSYGRGIMREETTRRPPLAHAAQKLDISRGRGKGPAARQ